MTKYRIKKVQRYYDDIKYYVQRKRFLFWTNVGFLSQRGCYFDTINSAKEAINILSYKEKIEYIYPSKNE